jgi:hypothetical protein
MPATTGMKGAGYYDQYSTAQLSAIQALQDWVDDAVANSRPSTVCTSGFEPVCWPSTSATRGATSW